MYFKKVLLKQSLVIITLFYLPCIFCDKREADAIGQWAKEFGEELWEVGTIITNMSTLKSNYESANTQVERKDPQNLLEDIVENLEKMLAKKMEAIKCIQQVAEEASEKYEYNETSPDLIYYNAKESKENCTEIDYESENDTVTYKFVCLISDPHFYNIAVNTNHSAVHVPSNVYDKLEHARTAIEWSEKLDEVFVQNYNSDPSLSWQYFGSSSGIMRQYPAMKWNEEEDKEDLFDCRTQSWFIEAATCSKDVIILLDHSGSMAGMPKHIAKLTVSSILDTLSNNDYVNIFNYSATTDELVPCFKDILVQATPENINVFKESLQDLPSTGGYANLSLAFSKSFELLQSYREKKGCIGNETECNQAIMLVTDGVPGNLTEVFEKYNWLNGGNHIPVRIFTYLIGREVTKVREIQWMACLNRGYYSHVQDLEEVTEKVLNYIAVIARPLVLQGIDRPISWTHAYADTRVGNKPYAEKNDNAESSYQLYTSAAIPVFDNKANVNNNRTRTANLLGVAGTDVPLEDFKKLAYPYKIGVNGYAFMVSNNGYVLLHPDMRPTYNGVLKDNYNSVDLVEIEQIDDDNGPREFNQLLLSLREALVNGTDGNILDVKLKYHYDEMRRASRETYNFYFAPLDNTPFSIGLAIPKNYGEYLIKVGDEIKKNRHSNVQITKLFEGKNWTIHPKWVYCKYHYQDNHHFSSAEEELLHFLEKTSHPSWEWYSQYEPSKKYYYVANDEDMESVDCSRKPHSADAYYCDKDLVQRLVFDAKITKLHRWRFDDDKIEKLFKLYGADVRFISTMSGLTRWEHIFDDDRKSSNNKQDFGHRHANGIDENWYKSAVLQHNSYDRESFVYTVPFDAVTMSNEIKVTGTYAIYPKEAGNTVPASVVGFEMSHSQMYERFMNLTKCEDCKSCSDYELDCYVVDHNGYIVISEVFNDTGKFFGEIDGAVMDAMLQEHIFDKITVYDYQALCFKTVLVSSDSNILSTPFNYIKILFNWFISKLFYLLIETSISQTIVEAGGRGCMPEIAEEKVGPKGHKKLRKGQNQEEEDFFNQVREPVYADIPYPCEKQRDLYILQQQLFSHSHKYSDFVPTNCSRPFYVKKIPKSNLMLIVIKSLYQSCFMKLTSNPVDMEYTDINQTKYPCNKLALNMLPRKPLSGCFNEHPLEHEITMCGRADKFRFNSILLLFVSMCYLFNLLLSNIIV